MKSFAVILLIALVFGFVRAEAEAPATPEIDANGPAAPFLLAHKKFSSTEVIIGDEITVTFSIHNAGRSPAFKVNVDDESTWGEGAVTSDKRTATFAKIAPGATESFSYKVKLPVHGEVSSDAARITYSADEASSTTLTTYSTRPNEEKELPHAKRIGFVEVLTAAEFERRHTTYAKEWATFIALLALPIGLPYYFYFTRTKELKVAEKRATAPRK